MNEGFFGGKNWDEEPYRNVIFPAIQRTEESKILLKKGKKFLNVG